MPTELKPCPFCGGDPVEFRYSGSPCVGCKDCIAYLGGEESDLTYAQLAEAWNLRADQQTVAQLQARVAELAAALSSLEAIGVLEEGLIGDGPEIEAAQKLARKALRSDQ